MTKSLCTLFQNLRVNRRKKSVRFTDTVVSLRPNRKILERLRKRKHDSAYQTHETEFGLRLRVPFKLYPHQVEIIKWCKARETNALVPGGIISAEMGLGKTLVTLSLLSMYLNQTMTRTRLPSLFLCNKSLLLNVVSDCKKFFGNALGLCVLHTDWKQKHTHNFTHVSTVDPKVETNLNNYDLVITTYETISKYHHKPNSPLSRLFRATQWFYVFADESQRLVNAKTKIFAATRALQCQHVFALTGTPIRNYASDLHSQLLCCKLPLSFVWSKENYQHRKLFQAIFCLRVQDTTISLPAKQETCVYLEMSTEEKEEYIGIYQDTRKLFHERTARIEAGQKKWASILPMLTKLRQCCVNQTKFKWVQSLYTQHAASHVKILVFSGFARKLCQLQAQLNLQKVPNWVLEGKTSLSERMKHLETFRTHEGSAVLLLTNGVGSLGLNLVEATHVVILEPWWNSTVTDQAAARAWRLGQTQPVFIHKLIVKDSFESRILQLCREKEKLGYEYLYGQMSKMLAVTSHILNWSEESQLNAAVGSPSVE